MPVYLRGSQEGLFSFVFFCFLGGGGYPCLNPDSCFKITNTFVPSLGTVCWSAWIEFNHKWY